MKRIFLILPLLLIGLMAFSQADINRTTPIGNVPATTATYNKRTVVDANLRANLTLYIPTGTTPTLNNAKDSTGAVFFKVNAASDTSFYANIIGTGWVRFPSYNKIIQLIGASRPDSTIFRTVANSKTLAQTQTALNLKQNTLVSGTNIKTLETQSILGSGNIDLTKSDVGLGNVDNTSDATKNSAVATLTNKTLTSPIINSPTGIVKGDVGLGNVDNTSDANKPVSTAQAASIATKEPIITAGTTAQYYRGDKSFQTLNTAAVPELTNLYYTEGRVSANTNVAANTAVRHGAVTIGTANGLSLSTQALSLGLASTSTNGALSSTDWNTFNGKESALTFGTGLLRTGNTITNTITNNNQLTNGAAYITATALSPYALLSGAIFTGVLETRINSSLVYSPTNSATFNRDNIKRNTNGATGTNSFTEYDLGVNAILDFGAVKNAGGFADFVWNTTTGSPAELMRLSSLGNLSLTGPLNVVKSSGSSLISLDGTGNQQIIFKNTGVDKWGISQNVDGTLSIVQSGVSDRLIFSADGSITTNGRFTQSNSVAGYNTIGVRNTSTATNAAASIDIGNDLQAFRGQVIMNSSTYTPSGIYKADGLVVYTGGVGGITLASQSASGDIRMFSGGSLALTISTSQNSVFTGSIKTAAPSGGAAATMKFGSTLGTGYSLTGVNTFRVEIDGVLYYFQAGTGIVAL